MHQLRPPLRRAVALGGAAFLLAACGGSDLADQAQQIADAARQAAEQAEDAEAAADETDQSDDQAVSQAEDTGDATSDAAGSDFEIPAQVASLPGQTPSGTVAQRGFEFTVTGMELVDLDQQAADETGVELGSRVRGFELVVDLDVFNATSRPGGPGQTTVSLRWDEPGSDNVVSLRGQLETREIPSLSSSSSTVTFLIGPDDADTLDVDSAALVFGVEGQSAAILPIGSQPELVTRLPIEQSGVAGTSFDADGVTVTIEEAWIHYDTASGGPLPDDEVLFELTYEIDATAVDAQTCSSRSTGSWNLRAADGAGYVDLGVSERCVTTGQSLDGILTGFILDADYAGEYTLSHERSGADQDFFGETGISLNAGEGQTHAERNP